MLCSMKRQKAIDAIVMCMQQQECIAMYSCCADASSPHDAAFLPVVVVVHGAWCMVVHS
jgi:hypothetical protein